MRVGWIVALLASGLLTWKLVDEGTAKAQQPTSPSKTTATSVKGTYLLEFELPQADGKPPVRGRFVITGRGTVAGADVVPPCSLGMFGFLGPAERVLKHMGPFELTTTSVLTMYDREHQRDGVVRTTVASQGDTTFDELGGSLKIEVYDADQDPNNLDESKALQVLRGTATGMRLVVE